MPDSVIADRDLIPDIWDLADMHVAEVTQLFEATRAEWAEPPRAAFSRRGRVEDIVTDASAE